MQPDPCPRAPMGRRGRSPPAEQSPAPQGCCNISGGCGLQGTGCPYSSRSPLRGWGHSSTAGPPLAPRRRGSQRRPLAGSHRLRRGAAPASCTRLVLGLLSPCGTLPQPPASSTDLWITFISRTIWEKAKRGNRRGPAGVAGHGALPEHLSPQSPIRAHALRLLGARQAVPINTSD